MQPAVLLLQVFLLAFSPGTEWPMPSEIPSNIWVQPELRETVARLWQGSPTFREQCQRIGEHRNFLVNVTINPALMRDRFCRAQCVMRVYTSGLVLAAVTVPDSKSLNLELIPHEFEHVLERIDGVDVRRQLRMNRVGVYATADNRIETDRARRAGRRAALEMQAVTLLTTRADPTEAASHRAQGR